MRVLFSYLLLLMPLFCGAQAIDNSFAYKQLNSDRYVRFNYENDYFSARDRFYTQGVHIEFAHPALKKNPVQKILPAFRQGRTKYGLAIEHAAYTPTSIQSAEILYGDRPFAATLLLKNFSVSVDEVRKQKLAASLSLGVIGPAAGGKEIQTTIHENTGNIIPNGWQYQIQNDIIINYQLNYEKNFLPVNDYLLLNADALARMGTLSNKLSTGITLMGGKLRSPFTQVEVRKNLYLFAYDRIAMNAIAYDATLQGGLFNRSSPYVIPAGDISRLCFENRFGFVLCYKSITLEYFQSYLTKEFATQADDHRWGGVQLAVSF